MKLEFSRQNFENPQIPNCMKLRPVEADLFNADGRIDRQIDRQTVMAKPIMAIRNFANAPKNEPDLYRKTQSVPHSKHNPPPL